MMQKLRIIWLAAVTAGIAAAQSAPVLNAAQIDAGKVLFVEKCGFCHGPDATGGESGPDLTRSDLVDADKAGDKIGPVVREGRPRTAMPAFQVSDQELAELIAFIHNQKIELEKRGNRKGVEVADLQTGNVEAGKKYFDGAGKCASCHSPTGDLKGLASRLKGLRLEERMLYPGNASAKATVTLPSGKTITGKLMLHDDFTIGVRDDQGWYHSWPTDEVKFTIDAPAEAHVDLLSKYTDADIHDLMAYLQTLK
jgi:cytochrome c oxidase cbb3-type subunit 3